MTRSGSFGGENGENIVSLADRLAQQEPMVEDQANTLATYSIASYATYHAARYVLNKLHNLPSNGFIVMVAEDRKANATRVVQASDGSQRYAIVVSTAQREIITADLDLQVVEEADKLREPLERFHTITHFARFLLDKQGIVEDQTIPPPVVAQEEVRTGSREECREITSWRAAAGLGILAVAPHRPELRRDITDYLGHVLHWRVLYLRSSAEFAATVNRELPPEKSIDNNYLVGICNPLEGFDLHRVLPAAPES